MAESQSTLSRRSFIAGVGASAAGAAAAVPLVSLGSEPAPAASTWSDAVARWREEFQRRIPTFRAAYLREIEALAEANRGRFLSGELHAGRDLEEEAWSMGDGEETMPGPDRVEALVEQHFGKANEMDAATVAVLLECSPHVPPLAPFGWNSDAQLFVVAAAWDVIAVARERGWYAVTPDEFTDPLLEPAFLEAMGVRS
jgi:hypothetical protein